MDLVDALSILLPVANDWQTIGTLMRVPPDVLENIRTREREEPRNCLRVMLVEMLKLTDPPPTWKALAKAVELINPAKAKEIREEYVGKSHDQQSRSSVESNSTVPGDPDSGMYSEVESQHPTKSKVDCVVGQKRELDDQPSHQGSHSPAKKPRLGTDGTTQTDEMNSQQHSDTYAQECPAQKHTTGIVVDDAHEKIIAVNTPVTVSQRAYEPSKQNTTVVSTPVTASVSSGACEGGAITSEPMDTPIQPKTENESFQSSSTTMDSDDQSRVEKYALLQTPRGYQKELARPGIRGENYIICLPTGTGKTLVASMIIADHLKRKMEEGKQGKVLFIVPTQHLAHQQKKKLEEYVNGITAVEVTGGTDETFIHPLLSQVDAIVCTPGKLIHELYQKQLQMSQFSLLVLDECHHTVKPSSPYGGAMEYYLKEKLSDSAIMPLVIGMTASPGVGAGKNPTLQKAIEHQITLCACVDATSGIKTNNSTELRGYESKPDFYTTLHEKRKADEPFATHVIRTMQQVEACLPAAVVVPLRYEKADFRYKQWAEGEISAALQRYENPRETIPTLKHLAEYSLALSTYEGFRFEDAYALRVINDIEPFPEDTATPMERCLNHLLVGLCRDLQHVRKIPNPLFDAVEAFLLSKFRQSPESRGIFFVHTIPHTRFITKWIKDSPKLSKLVQASPITGHNRAADISQSEQGRIMEAFRNGKYNLLVATSVLHEGIDVPECNFVIRFQPFANEIAEIQARGRARAENSIMYTVATSSSRTQYLQLLLNEKETLASKALQTLPQDSTSLRPQILTKQQEIIHKQRQREKLAEQQRSRWDPNKVDILCSNCDFLVCKGSDVYTYNVGSQSHYVVPDKEFEEKVVKTKPKPQDLPRGMSKVYDIACKGCRNKLGMIAQWQHKDLAKDVIFPVLKCSQIRFRFGHETEYKKKWKDAPIKVQSLSDFLKEFN